MKEMIELIAKSLVSCPDQVVITEKQEEIRSQWDREQEDDNETAPEKTMMTVFELHVAPEDMGKVIGKQGRIAKALRTLVKAAATRENQRVMVEIC